MLAGGYRLSRACSSIPAAWRRCPGFGLERVRFANRAAGRRFRAHRALSRGVGRPLARGLLRLRAALARALQRGRISLPSTKPMSACWSAGASIARGSTPSPAAMSARRSPAARTRLPRLQLYRPGAGTMPSFVIAGSGEVPEGRANYRDHIVASGDTSPAGMQQKARWVLGEMERRLAALALSWADTTDAQVYTVQDIPLPGARCQLVSRRLPSRAGLHLAFRPAANCGPGIRDGLPRREHGIGLLIAPIRMGRDERTRSSHDHPKPGRP